MMMMHLRWQVLVWIFYARYECLTLSESPIFTSKVKDLIASVSYYSKKKSIHLIYIDKVRSRENDYLEQVLLNFSFVRISSQLLQCNYYKSNNTAVVQLWLHWVHYHAQTENHQCPKTACLDLFPRSSQLPLRKKLLSPKCCNVHLEEFWFYCWFGFFFSPAKLSIPILQQIRNKKNSCHSWGTTSYWTSSFCHIFLTIGLCPGSLAFILLPVKIKIYSQSSCFKNSLFWKDF